MLVWYKVAVRYHRAKVVMLYHRVKVFVRNRRGGKGRLVYSSTSGLQRGLHCIAGVWSCLFRLWKIQGLRGSVDLARCRHGDRSTCRTPSADCVSSVYTLVWLSYRASSPICSRPAQSKESPVICTRCHSPSICDKSHNIR